MLVFERVSVPVPWKVKLPVLPAKEFWTTPPSVVSPGPVTVRVRLAALVAFRSTVPLKMSVAPLVTQLWFALMLIWLEKVSVLVAESEIPLVPTVRVDPLTV